MQEMQPLIVPVVMVFAAVIFMAMGSIIIFLWLILRRLFSMEKRLANLPDTLESAAKASSPSATEKAPGGAFETFLNEDPARWNLPKNEQFAAYRKWRQEKGLNWSGS